MRLPYKQIGKLNESGSSPGSAGFVFAGTLVPQNTAVFAPLRQRYFSLIQNGTLVTVPKPGLHQKKEPATALASNCVIRHNSIKQKGVLDFSGIFWNTTS